MKKKIVSIIIVLTILIIPTLILISRNNNKEVNKDIIFKTLEVEVGEKKNISDLIKKIDGKLTKDEVIDTSKIKNIEYEIEYIKENKKKYQKVKISIVDKTPPIVILNNSYTIEKATIEDLASKIFCADNYDKNPKCTIEGKYDTNEIGEYKLKYIAIDSSNNKTEKEFILKVIEDFETSNTRTNFSDVIKEYKTKDTEIGIDVSKWQSNINWEKVKNEGATFAMVRIGYQNGYGGESKLDPYFKKNIEGAIKEGIKVGVYYFSYATTTKEANEQALWVMNELKPYNIELPIAFDWENWSTFGERNLSLIDINKISYEFLKTIEDNNYDSMLYGSKNYLENIWFNKKGMKYDNIGKVWLAHYTKNTTYEGKYYMWQLCSNGKIDGINGNVDINIMYNE